MSITVSCMKYTFRIILLLFLITSCEESNENPVLNTIQNNDENDEQIIVEAIIDETDLIILPEDTGGIHQAYPLGSTATEFGHYVYTPGGYTNDGPEYPLIIFLHGWGAQGDSRNDEKILDIILYHGLPSLIKMGQWNPKFPFIVVSPQLVTEYWPANKIHSFIEYLIENYQINTDRIYLTGLSLGGGGCWYYVGQIEDNYAAAILPISASGNENLIENLRKIPIWAFHGAKDELVKAYDNFGSVPMVDAINKTNPQIKAKVTVYPLAGHNGWTRTYNGTGMFQGEKRFDQYDMNIYNWLLQYKKE